jgi:alanine racemase
MIFMRPTYSVISLANLKYNYLNIRRRIKLVRVMAVVKADAYGHGVKEVCNALNKLENKPEYYGVAIAGEGAELRGNGVRQPVLVFEPVSKEEAPLIFKHKLIPTVSEDNHLKILLSAGKGKVQKVHIKVNTGMNRLGINYREALAFISRIASDKRFRIDGIYTHFASSDEKDKTFAELQLERFRKLLNTLKEMNINYGLAHAANSGAILDMTEAYFDMVRPGISLYGYYPSLETSESIRLKPVMSLYSVVNSLKIIDKGEGVSYNRKFITDKRTRIAAVPLGYADGFRRDMTHKASAIINGESFRQVGTVTMDRIMFDVGNETKIKTGDKVILLGSIKNKKIDAWDWSRLINTIPYEITCGISKRVPRIYK